MSVHSWNYRPSQLSAIEISSGSLQRKDASRNLALALQMDSVKQTNVEGKKCTAQGRSVHDKAFVPTNVQESGASFSARGAAFCKALPNALSAKPPVNESFVKPSEEAEKIRNGNPANFKNFSDELKQEILVKLLEQYDPKIVPNILLNESHPVGQFFEPILRNNNFGDQLDLYRDWQKVMKNPTEKSINDIVENYSHLIWDMTKGDLVAFARHVDDFVDEEKKKNIHDLTESLTMRYEGFGPLLHAINQCSFNQNAYAHIKMPYKGK